jgi:5-methylcytosine-specific restriction endonuclease McrA
MTRFGSKLPRLRLDPESYRRLRHQVLERDGWRCQRCGCLGKLQVHHLRTRSRLGDDAEHNLISLCVPCHREVHTRKQTALFSDNCFRQGILRGEE